MNVELLRKIAAVIQEKPGSFDMEMWHIEQGGAEHYDLAAPRSRECGTAHCIGGWAHVLTPSFPPQMESETAGREALQLSAPQANRLFLTSQWPDKFSRKYQRLVTQRGRARVAAARIEHFISTDGRE